MAEGDDAPVDEATFAQLLESTGGDREFVAELIDTYLDDAPREVAAMRRAASAGQPEELVRPAHSLKGTSASLGALALSERSRALEMAARAGKLDGAREAIDAIEAELVRVTAALLSLRSSSEGD